ncbi:MAG: GcrA family cell cycle regulator, partial [Pseudorhodoplanes sp.]
MIVERKADAKPHVWTPERVDELARLWAQCHSAAEIARLLGCGLTRCAVLGKVHRLKLASHATPPRLVTRPARLRHAADAPLPDSPHSRDLSFLDLKPRDCR